MTDVARLTFVRHPSPWGRHVLWRYAEICPISNVMKLYLESVG